MPNILIGSQITIEDLSFLPLISRMNSCTSVLQRMILCHSLAAKHPCQHLRVKSLFNNLMRPMFHGFKCVIFYFLKNYNFYTVRAWMITSTYKNKKIQAHLYLYLQA